MLTGRVVREPDIKWMNVEKPYCVANFTLAVKKKFKTKNGDADFLRITVFYKTAEFVDKYVRKADVLEVEGSISLGVYTNKEGKKVYETQLIADTISWVPQKPKSENNAPQAGAPQMPNAVMEDTKKYSSEDINDYTEVPEMDDPEMPFA